MFLGALRFATIFFPQQSGTFSILLSSFPFLNIISSVYYWNTMVIERLKAVQQILQRCINTVKGERRMCLIVMKVCDKS